MDQRPSNQSGPKSFSTIRSISEPSRCNKNQVSRSEDEAKKEGAATIEDEEDKEIMEVLGAEEVDTDLDYEVDSEMTTITECSQKMKCI